MPKTAACLFALHYSINLAQLLFLVITYGTVFGFVPIAAKNLGASYAEIGLLTTIYLLPV
jgi:hypothetical protein